MNGAANGTQTVDEVLEALDGIIAQAMQAGSRVGYFAAIYRKVTAKVAEGIATGFSTTAIVCTASTSPSRRDRARPITPPLGRPDRARDARVARLAGVVLNPGLLTVGLLVIRSRESSDVRRNIEMLKQVEELDLQVVEARVRQERASTE